MPGISSSRVVALVEGGDLLGLLVKKSLSVLRFLVQSTGSLRLVLFHKKKHCDSCFTKISEK